MIDETAERTGDYHSDDDKHLLALIKARNMLAFRQLYNRYAPQLLVTARRILPAEDAEDLVQEVFTKIWTQTDDFYLEVRNIKSFLFKSTYNHALNALKKRLTDMQRSHEAVLLRPSHDHSTQSYVAVKDLQQALAQTVQLMPPRQATVYRMFAEENLDYKQIAARLGKSPDTIRLQLIAARKFVKEHLSQHYDYGLQACVAALMAMLHQSQ